MCDPSEKPDKLTAMIYQRYQDLAQNEDRLFNERLSNVLMVQSILIAAFMVTLTAKEPGSLNCIRLVIAAAGVVIALSGSTIAFAASKGWSIWAEKIKEMEASFASDAFAFQMPSVARAGLDNWGKYPSIVGIYVLPLSFIGLWVILSLTTCF